MLGCRDALAGWLATVVGTKRQRWATRGSEVLAEAGVEEPEVAQRGREGEALKVGVLAFQSSNFLAMVACDWVSSLEGAAMQLPRHASSLQQWYYPPSLSIWGLEIGVQPRRRLLDFDNCHRAYAKFRFVVPEAGTGGPPRTEAQDQRAFLSSVCDVRHNASATSLID